MLFEIGRIPDKTTPDKPQTEEFYKDMLNSVREQATSYPGYTIGFIIHAQKSGGPGSIRKFNTDILESLVNAKCDIDTEVVLRFEKGHRNSRRTFRFIGHKRLKLSQS